MRETIHPKKRAAYHYHPLSLFSCRLFVNAIYKANNNYPTRAVRAKSNASATRGYITFIFRFRGAYNVSARAFKTVTCSARMCIYTPVSPRLSETIAALVRCAKAGGEDYAGE